MATLARLEFEAAIASLPPLPIEVETYAPKRYPKGHPRGGQFMPKNGGDPAPTSSTSDGNLSPLGKAKAAIANKLRAIAEKLGFKKSAVSSLADQEAKKLGLDMPKGFELAPGRAGRIPDPESNNLAEMTDFTETVNGQEFERTYYPLDAGKTKKGVTLLGYSEISWLNQPDDLDPEEGLHNVSSQLYQVPAKDDKALRSFIKGGGTAHTYSFTVNNSLNQNQFATPELAAQIIKVVKTDFSRVLSAVDDGDVITVSAWQKDGRGKGREAAYRRMGFSKPNKQGNMYALKRRGKLYPIQPK